MICAAPAYLARYGTPDARGSRRSSLPVPYGLDRPQRVAAAGRRGEVRWKRDAVLRCNDGYALRQAAIAGAGLLMQPEVLLADALASGSRCACWRRGLRSRGLCICSGAGSSASAEADAVYRPPSAGNGRRADNDPRVGIITPSAAPAASRQSDREDLRSPPTGGSAAV